MGIETSKWITACFISFLVFETIYFNSDILAPVSWILLSTLIILFIFYMVLKGKYKTVIGILFMLALILTIKYIVQLPIEDKSIILSQIDSACRVISRAENPYLGGTRTHFMYLPGLMLPYIIVYFIKVKIDTVNLIAFLILGLLIIKLLRNNKISCLPHFIAAATILFAVKNIEMVTKGHLPFYWLLIYISFYLLITRRYYSSAFFIGLAMATRQETFIIMPLLAIYYFKNINLEKTIRSILIAVGTYAIFVLPIWIYMGNEFWYYSYFKIFADSEKYFGNMGLPFNQISLSTFLYGLFGKTTLLFAQAGVVILAAVLTWFRAFKCPLKFTALCGLVIIFFVSLNYLVQWYYYTTGLILISSSILFDSLMLQDA